MIYFSFKFESPWAKDPGRVQHDYFWREPKISRRKAMCIQLSKAATPSILRFDLDLSWRGHDHAGPGISLELFGYFFDFNIYDVRHWNYEEGRWESDKEIEQQIKEYEELLRNENR